MVLRFHRSSNKVKPVRVTQLADSGVRKKLTFAWLTVSILWSITRSFIIRGVFGSHGTNSLDYLFIDLATTIPFAIYSARAAFSWLDKSPYFVRQALVASLCFVAPDLYVFATARQVSLWIWVTFISFIVAMAVLAIWHSRRDAINDRNE